MKRFERLGHTPVAVRELAVEGTTVTTREDGETASTTFASEAKARAHADALVAQWRADGFVPITRLAPVEREQSVVRAERREWNGPTGDRWFREIAQKDDAIREIHGRIVGGSDERYGAPEIIRSTTIKQASASFDAKLARIEAEAARQEAEAKLAAEREAARKAARKAEREANRRERQLRNRHPELEAECLASPNAPAPWQVYADGLIDHGDVLGEAAALSLHDSAAADAALRREFPELVPRHDDEVILLEFRWGFVRHVQVQTHRDAGAFSLSPRVKRVLDSPACRFVDSIRLGLASLEGYANTWASTLGTICESVQAPTLRELRLDAFEPEDCELSWVPYGDLAFAWAKLPALELLKIRAGLGGNLGTLDLPALRTFIRETGGLPRADLESVLALVRPHLEHLELWIGTPDYGGEVTLDDLAPIFAARGLPALRHLGIVNSELSDTIIPALVASRVLPQLHSLDLSRGIAARTFTDHLVAHAPAFRHLASLDLSRNLLTDDEIAQIEAVLDNVILVDQRERDVDYTDDPGERYIDVGE